ncbi:hypothetical protein CBR_g31948 [Chara braunii]|uniref:SAP30-binding protein n=1 Tax=Chara braunii TaxID=69332 RepID=A0A388LG38_CHABU|nr:hypothetical protein CBR_g31948 [Chara braunii]|eukprot:GBG81274.1 hypothetical protein CBR_g31948 [Chara braunii]
MDVTMAKKRKPEGIASLMVYADDDEEDEPEEGEEEKEQDDDDDDEEDDDNEEEEEKREGEDKRDRREIRMGEEEKGEDKDGISEKEEEGEVSEDEETDHMDMEVDDSRQGEVGERVDADPALPPIIEAHVPTPSPPPPPPPPLPPLLPNRSVERTVTPPAPSVSPLSPSDQPISQPQTRPADVSVLGIVDYEGGAVSVRRPTPGSVRIISPGLVVTPREDDGNAAADASQGDQALGTPFNGSLRHSPLVRSRPPASPNGEEGTASARRDVEDPLESFLPPPTTEKCPEHLQRKFKDFLDLKASGVDFNKSIMEKKDYRNPDFLERVVRYHNIDEKGSCYPKDKFNPHGYDPNDYYDRLGIITCNRICQTLLLDMNLYPNLDANVDQIRTRV